MVFENLRRYIPGLNIGLDVIDPAAPPTVGPMTRGVRQFFSTAPNVASQNAFIIARLT